MADTQIQTPMAPKILSHLRSPYGVILGILLLVLILDASNFTNILTKTITAFLGTLPFIALAVFLVAYLRAAGAEVLIAKAFAGRQIRMIFMAALIGGFAPFCSCEVIPFIAGLLALGAPLAPVMAFWLSSPLIDPPTLLITASALGWTFAVAKAASALGLGLLGGFGVYAIQRFGGFSDPLKPNTPTSSCCAAPSMDRPVQWKVWTQPDRMKVFQTEAINNALFLTKWLLLAYVLEAVMISYIPADAIVRVVGGDGVGSIALAALVGMPAYLNSYVAAPLLAGLTEQGMAMGAALSFMTAGAISCIPAMAAVWSLVRLPVFISYVVFGLTGAIIAGVVFQIII